MHHDHDVSWQHVGNNATLMFCHLEAPDKLGRKTSSLVFRAGAQIPHHPKMLVALSSTAGAFQRYSLQRGDASGSCRRRTNKSVPLQWAPLRVLFATVEEITCGQELGAKASTHQIFNGGTNSLGQTRFAPERHKIKNL